MFKVGDITMWRRVLAGGVVSLGLTLSGCASDGNQSGPNTVAAGQESCQDARRELNRLDARGVPSRIEAANQGKRLSAAQQAEVDRYNRLLKDYLGGRCHL